MPEHRLGPRTVQTRIVTACIVLAAVAIGFLAFAEFGGWYYVEGGVRTSTVYDYDNDAYNVVHTPNGNEYWDSDALWNEPTLIAPLSIAILCLAGSIWFLLKAARHDGGQRAVKRAGIFAAVATGILAVWAIVYASSMGEVADWWFGAAFYAGISNAALLTGLAFWSLRRGVWDGEARPASGA